MKHLVKSVEAGASKSGEKTAEIPISKQNGTGAGLFRIAVVIGMSLLLHGQLASAQEEAANDAGSTSTASGGSLEHKVDSQSGRFTYQLPLIVPPGRQGAQPQLTLGYVSGGGNSWCGVGWGMEVNYIQRNTKYGVPIKWSGGSPTPLKEYDDAKSFVAVVGGVSSTLVLASPADQDPLDYRPEIETEFLQFKFFKSANYWQITDKNGNSFFFGQTQASRMENTNVGWTAAAAASSFRWGMDRVLDVNGNETVLTYTKDGGLLYLSNISYNGNVDGALPRTHTVDFILTNRPDANIAFNTGYRLETRKLLSEIQMKVSGSPVRKYVLNYTNSASTLRSLLSSVTQYGSDFSTPLPAVKFTYQAQQFQFGPDTDWLGATNNHTKDLFIVTNNPRQGDGYWTNVLDDEWNQPNVVDSDHNVVATLTDMDGDGLPDRVMRKAFSSFTYFDVQRNTGSGFTPMTPSHWAPINSPDPTDNDWGGITGMTTDSRTDVDLFDINGDGLPDRVRRKSSAPYERWVVQYNSGLPGPNAFSNTNFWQITAEDSDNNVSYRAIRYGTNMDIVDMNGDGLPDRVMAQLNQPHNRFKVQLNTGNGFSDLVDWYPVYDQASVGSMFFDTSDFYSALNLYIFVSKLNTPTTPLATYLNGLLSATTKSQIATFVSSLGLGSTSPLVGNLVNDLNQIISNGSIYDAARFAGVSLSQSTLTLKNSQPLGVDIVCLNRQLLHDAFSELADADLPDRDWRTLSQQDKATKAMLLDINGDGLPDRVMRKRNSPYDSFIVQYNNGAGFEAPESWGGVMPGNDDKGANSPVGSDSFHTWSTLIDINGDGLPDRVKRGTDTPYTHWRVQLNTGSGFGPLVDWTGLDGQGNSNDRDWNNISTIDGDEDTYVDFLDINGDGLPDRVMRKENQPYGKFVVQLNKGPFPDLLVLASNDVGGAVSAAYVPSITWDNRDKDWTTDPWTEGAKGLLSYPIQTVCRTVVYDGFGNSNQTAYAYKGGYYNTTKRDFRGFHRVEETDCYGLKTLTYYHQGGGYNGSSKGEYQDQEGKQGIPYLVENYDTNGVLTHQTLSKVELAQLSNGANFPYVSQSVRLDFAANGTTYRASAEQLTYDPNTGVILTSLKLGEVGSVNLATHQITDLDPNDNVRTETTYKASPWVTRPDVITISKADLSEPRKTRFTYDGHGNLTEKELWLTPGNRWIPQEQVHYDSLGNPYQMIDAANVVTEATFDTTYKQFPVKKTIAPGTALEMSILTEFDPRSGQATRTTNHLGFITRTDYDVFFRSTASFINDAPYAEPTLWHTKTDYLLNGIAGNTSNNRVHSQAYDHNDVINGVESFTYLDGLGRTIQTRVESETNNVYRCSDTYYETDRKDTFSPLAYFGTGSTYVSRTGAQLGTLTQLDAARRERNMTPAVLATYDGSRHRVGTFTLTGGDANAPVASTMMDYEEGGNPWARISTDSEGKTIKSYANAFGLATNVIQVTATGNITTRYNYNYAGDLVDVIDNANNQMHLSYDSLGRKTSMSDPDMGTWNYAYDDAGNATNQVDAKNQSIRFTYDSLGRMRFKDVYNSTGTLTRRASYQYDSSIKPGCSVSLGQLAAVTETSASCNCITDERFWSYDYKGRVLKEGVYSWAFGTFVGTNRYNEADQLVEQSYPNDVARLLYTYQNGVLAKIQSLKGTGDHSETFYELASINEMGQPVEYLTHNGQVKNHRDYFANSKRLQTISVSKGSTSILNKSYSFDRVSNVKSITDNVPSHTGNASGTLQNLQYDDLHRLVGLTDASGSRTYSYDALGNLVKNGDTGAGTYLYASAKPHAVTSANSKTYQYDANGNMINRNGQVLVYDEENRLIQATNDSANIYFGYGYDNARLWKYNKNNNQYTCYVSELYEYRESDTAGLCYVYANGQRITAFRPTSNVYSLAGAPLPWTERMLASVQRTADTANRGLNWSLRPTHIQTTTTFCAVLFTLVAFLLGRKYATFRVELRELKFYRQPLWRRALLATLIPTFLLATTPVHAQFVPGEVFYYYHTDQLGSSNVTTDRSGEVIQQDEYKAYGSDRYVQNNADGHPEYDLTHRYTGQVYDGDTGLYYYNARYYDPELGRFIQADTVVPSAADPQTLNRYAYAANNPLKYVDPSGHWFGIDDALLTALLIKILTAVVIGAAVGAIVAAVNGGNILDGAGTGAYTAALGTLGVVGIALTAIVAGAKGEDVGKAILMAVVGAVISWGTSAVLAKVIPTTYDPTIAQDVMKVQTWGQVGEYGVIKLSAGALQGGIDGTIKGEGFGKGALGGLESAGIDFAEKGAVLFAKWSWQEATHGSNPIKDVGFGIKMSYFKFEESMNRAFLPLYANYHDFSARLEYAADYDAKYDAYDDPLPKSVPHFSWKLAMDTGLAIAKKSALKIGTPYAKKLYNEYKKGLQVTHE